MKNEGGDHGAADVHPVVLRPGRDMTPFQMYSGHVSTENK